MVCDDEVVSLLAVLEPLDLVPLAEPVAELRRTLSGRTLAADVGCVPKAPLPTIQVDVDIGI
jgi:hypothetical protein